MVQQAGQRLVDREQDQVGEIQPGEPSPQAMRRVYLEADGAWLRRQKPRRLRANGPPPTGDAATRAGRRVAVVRGRELQPATPDRPRWEAFWAQSLSETGQHTPAGSPQSDKRIFRDSGSVPRTRTRREPKNQIRQSRVTLPDRPAVDAIATRVHSVGGLSGMFSPTSDFQAQDRP